MLYSSVSTSCIELTNLCLTDEGYGFIDGYDLRGLTMGDVLRDCVSVYCRLNNFIYMDSSFFDVLSAFDSCYTVTYSGAEEYGYNQGFADGLVDGYQDGFTEGCFEGYANGYSDGEIYGVGLGHESGYQEGYTEGIEDGYIEGYDVGHEEGEGVGWHNGFSKGQTDALESTDTLKDTIFSIFEAPVTLINGFLDFEILGINLAGFVKAILTLGVTALIVTFILKLIKG